jgi:hypothetical protein
MSISARRSAPITRKNFHAALVGQLRQHVPTLGELTAGALATRLEQIIEDFFPAGERLRMGQLVWLAVGIGMSLFFQAPSGQAHPG